MNRLVRKHYPVPKRPDDLRARFEGPAEVRATIDVGLRDESKLPETPRKTLEGGFAMRRPPFLPADQTNRHLRTLRDEWD